MKVLFVNPPTDTGYASWYPPLGIAYLSSCLKQQTTWQTACCDASIGESPLQKVKAEQPDLIAFTCTTLGYGNAVKIAAKLRHNNIKTPMIMGGQHISALPSTLPGFFDACVVGEGENAIVNICRELESSDFLTRRIYSAPRIENLDSLPFPDRDMFNMQYYLQPQSHSIDMVGVGTNMITSRGCLYRCIFCSSSQFFKAPVRANSARYVADEMEMLKEKYRVEYINVWDDLFTFSVERLEDLAFEVHTRKLDLKLSVQCHAPTFTRHVAELLKRIGVVYCGFGFEASTPKMLEYLKCGVATVDDNRRAVMFAHEYGMKAGSGFLTNVPEQTQADLDANDQFIAETHLDAYRKYILCPYPGSPLWSYAKQKGLVSDDMDFTQIFQSENGRNVKLN